MNRIVETQSVPLVCYSIVPARAADLAALPAIELAAAALFKGYIRLSPDIEFTPPEEFVRAHARGHLWVALTEDRPVGFALVETLDSGQPHLEEIDVLPEHGRGGVGTALVRAVCEWVKASGHAAITLTTFRNVPWNMPFYARMGFVEVPADQLSAELAAIVRYEEGRGLSPRLRVVMRYRVPKS